MNVLETEGLSKSYPAFRLKNIDFSMKKGYITGFVGENGAGKTTFLHCILNLIKRDSGKVRIFGRDMDGEEINIKQDIAFMSGETSFYPRSKLNVVTGVFKKFYSNWDDSVYSSYMKIFKLDEGKRISELSKGMRMKYSIALALSHHARLIVLDEPTSGLDPVARDTLLEIFQDIVTDDERSILFSTHITSDLDKCADYVAFIKDGQMLMHDSKESILERYSIVSGPESALEAARPGLVSYKTGSFGFTGLMDAESAKASRLQSVRPQLDDILIYLSKAEG